MRHNRLYDVLLSLIVLIPLSALFLKTASAPWEHVWQTISSRRATRAR